LGTENEDEREARIFNDNEIQTGEVSFNFQRDTWRRKNDYKLQLVQKENFEPCSVGHKYNS
jgi:hypothetical protein